MLFLAKHSVLVFSPSLDVLKLGPFHSNKPFSSFSSQVRNEKHVFLWHHQMWLAGYKSLQLKTFFLKQDIIFYDLLQL